MKTAIFLTAILLTANVLQAQIIHIPADYPTIQLGIAAANPGDTVLVSPGTYMENINYNGKKITVASLFLTTQDTSFISQTIIDGNLNGPVVIFYQDEDFASILCGFTITNGHGGIYCQNSSPILINLLIRENSNPSGGWGPSPGGAGISCSHASPVIKNVTMTNNISSVFGGGISCLKNSIPFLSNVTIANNTAASKGGGIYCQESVPVFDPVNLCNIYSNTAFEGNDIATNTLLNVIVDTFSVINPNQYHAFPINYFTFNILHGYHPQAAADLYVSPYGNNSNSGLSSQEPVKTIHHAYSFILADSLHPRTIHLLEGNYSPSSNGELFPVCVPDHISLAGVSEATVYLNAEGGSRVFNIIGNNTSHISGMTISGGNVSGEFGGGILCMYSDPVIEHVIITGNTVTTEYPGFTGPLGGYGGGLYLANSNPVIKNSIITGNLADRKGGGVFCYASNPILQNSTIINNTASLSGGGMSFEGGAPVMENLLITLNTADVGGGMHISGTPVLKNVTLFNNTAKQGGGIYFSGPGSVFDTSQRCNIYQNTADLGMDLYSNSFVKVVLDTFSVLHATDYYAFPVPNYSFDILHGKITQVNADLYVSPDGSDDNPGVTIAEPLKTIRHATSRIVADSANPRTIHLMYGAYGLSTTGETFPVRLPMYMNIEGISDSLVTLVGEGNPAVIELINNTASVVSGISIVGGKTSGIHCLNSSPIIQDLRVSNNGTGILCENSDPFLNDIVATSNETGISCSNSRMKMHNHLISKNGIGLRIDNSSGVHLDSVSITGNYIGITCDGSDHIFINHVSCKDNEDRGLVTYEANTTITNSDFSDNAGSGISLDNSGTLIENSTVKNNHSCGIVAWESDLTMKNSLLADNKSDIKGGGIYSYLSTLSLEEVTVSGNASQGGGALYYDKSATMMVNSVMWNDTPREIESNIQYGAPNSLTISYCNIQGGKDSIYAVPGYVNWLEGNINADPGFTGTGDHPYRLTAGSPCRNAGNPDTVGLLLPVKDLAGSPRIWEGRIDMGAYEWNNVGTEELRFTNYDLRVTNYPNPFNSGTTFLYELKESSQVSLQIFNSFGKLVDEPLHAIQSKGGQSFQWNTDDLPAGIYLYRIDAGPEVGGGKIIKW